MKESTSALRSLVVRYAGKMNWPGILFCLAPLLVFLLVACLLRANPFQWVPLWSDEAGWYVQVNSVVKFGAPLGYTGYNEMHAAVGTFGPWGAFMIWAMALFGKVFGWHYCSPLFMNVVYWMLANLVFLLFTRPGRTVLMKLAALNFILFLSIQYMFVGMGECARFSMAIVLAGLFCYLLQDENRNRKGYLVMLGVVAPVLLFLFVNCYILFSFLLPVYGYAWFKYLNPRRCRILLLVSLVAILPVLIFKVCSFIQVQTTAAFPENAVAACLYQTNLADFLKVLKTTLVSNIKTADFIFILRNAKESYGCISSYLLCYYCLAIVVWVQFLTTLKARKKPHSQLLLAVFALSIFVLAFLALYSTGASWTYMRGLNVALVFSLYLLCILDWPKLHPALFCLMLMQFFPFANAIGDNVAARYSEMSAYGGGYKFLEKYSTVFSEKLAISQSKEPWDNTIACYGRPSNLGCAFPAGLSWNYIMDGHAVSKPRYIVTGRDMQSFGGYRKTYEDNLICIFERIRGNAE